MAARNRKKMQKELGTEHERRKRNGLERRVARDEDDHPQDPLRQASVYEELPRPPHVPRNINSTRGYHPSGYELGGFGGGPGERPWQVPWGGGYNPADFADMTTGSQAQATPGDYLGSGAAASPPVTPAPLAQASALPSQYRPVPAADPGAFGGAGLGGYNEGAFTLGPFFGHSINYGARPPAQAPAPLAPSYPPPQQPAGFSGRGPKGYTRTDERIWEDVCERLLLDDFVDASNIEVNVEGGEVTLNGAVPDRETKRRAEDLIDRLPGVQHVQNNLRFKR